MEVKEAGKLKIFFGLCAGVGKTYAMLKEAQQKLEEGVNVVIGTIDTHGRKETEELLYKLPIIPEKWVKYKDTSFKELDLEGILNIHPELILIDELAHASVPGSKHSKRWQDVVEILDAGINVFTTLNIQHVESQKYIIENLIGVQAGETVPDFILERAAAIEFIDISPADLLQRLKEGKVYLGDQLRTAALQNFFKEKNLLTLHEIGLHFKNEKIDSFSHAKKGWKTPEKLMALINPSLASEHLIRNTKRLALELDAPWIAVYVDIGIPLDNQDRENLNKYLDLARELGAEIVITHDFDLFTALQRIARQKDVTRLFITRQPKKKFSFKSLLHGNFFDTLESQNKNMDIFILRQFRFTDISKESEVPWFSSSWAAYRLVLAFGVGATTLGFLINPILGYTAVGFIFLFGILVLSFLVGRGPIFLAALLSAFCWGFFFIPPKFTLKISDPQDLILLIIYFIIAGIMGALTSRAHEYEQFLQKDEKGKELLYSIEKEFVNATNFDHLRLNVIKRLENLFPGKFDLLTKNQEGQLTFDGHQALLQEEKEKTTANWVFQHGEAAGWSTSTLSSAKGLYFSIKYFESSVGILAYYPKQKSHLSVEEINFIQTIAHQLGIYLERFISEEQHYRQSYTHQIERLYRSFFHSINRAFLPLDEMIKINHQIRQMNRDVYIDPLLNQTEKLNLTIKLTVDNLIAMSKIESGFVHFNQKLQPIEQLMECCFRELNPFMNNNSFDLTLPSPSVLLSFDFDLLKLAVNNLILISIENSTPSTPIIIKIQMLKNEFCLSILYETDKEIKPLESLAFNHFHHGDPLSELSPKIINSIVDMHQGKIETKKLEMNKMEISVIIPMPSD